MLSRASKFGKDAIRPRIFQIGFNKCGTRSFHDFFEKNGIKSVHYKRGELARGISDNIHLGRPPLEGWDKWTAFTDMQWVKKSGVIEACGFYKEFATYYPRSYFILNTRSKEGWIHSRLNHGTSQNYANRYRQGLNLSSISETVDAWSAMWDMHHENVRAFFAQTSQHFLIYNIEEDTPDTLVRFLAPDFKTEASFFGHEGKSAASATADTPTSTSRNPYVTISAAPKVVPMSKPKAALSTPSAIDKLDRRFVPHNDIVSFDEAARLPPYDAVPVRCADEGWTGNLIVAIVQDQAPYLLEWISYHRAIGFNHFLIFSHNCSDGTDDMLNYLQELGILTHIVVDVPESGTLRADVLKDVMKHPVVFQADWVVHIEVNEFVNVRTGNGTFACLLDRLPNSVTNIAMTWRIFGSAGNVDFVDAPTIARFDRCAPAYLPKPYTAWGFKTATSNIGAYQSLSAHRPGHLLKEFGDDVFWVNGSGEDITKDRSKSGWRSNAKIVGYELVQINRYAVRSIDEFLIARARNSNDEEKPNLDSWINLNWNSVNDLTIQRNLPRMRAELDRLKEDATLAEYHNSAVAGYLESAATIKDDPEALIFAEVAGASDLDDISRISHILKLDERQRQGQAPSLLV